MASLAEAGVGADEMRELSRRAQQLTTRQAATHGGPPPATNGVGQPTGCNDAPSASASPLSPAVAVAAEAIARADDLARRVRKRLQARAAARRRPEAIALARRRSVLSRGPGGGAAPRRAAPRRGGWC